MKEIDKTTRQNIDCWLNSPIDKETKATIKHQLTNNPQSLIDAFYTKLSFGTGGLRGIMGIGTNRMNKYTVMMTTQGLANHLNKNKKDKTKPAVIIGYDSRQNSKFFAEISASVLAANNIHVFLFSTICPTPVVSFGCRLKNCHAAIVITASHNPPEYNGYKVYGKDGGQVVFPEDKEIINEVAAVNDISLVKMTDSTDHTLIKIVNKEIYLPYLECIKKYQFYPKDNAKYGHELNVVYTPLHGTGAFLVPKALEDWGFSNISLVELQMIPDGAFPTVEYPNPEDKRALELGVETMLKNSSDILIATDPDADRVGLTVLHKGEIYYLNGNQVACICLYHILEALKTDNRIPEKAAFIKTIGTTELFKVIAESYGAHCFDVLTGFKYIAEKIQQWEENDNPYQFIFGGEESYGYLLGTDTRDKDAIISSLIICEAALQAKRKGMTLVDQLFEIYKKFGVYTEYLQSIQFEESKAGKRKMQAGMDKLYNDPPKSISGINVESIEDYTKSLKTNLITKKTEQIDLPKSNVLRFWLSDGSKIMIRPSGTEPKIKIYAGVVIKKFDNVENALEKAQKHAEQITESLKTEFK